jgi:hypothetical protein
MMMFVVNQIAQYMSTGTSMDGSIYRSRSSIEAQSEWVLCVRGCKSSTAADTWQVSLQYVIG